MLVGLQLQVGEWVLGHGGEVRGAEPVLDGLELVGKAVSCHDGLLGMEGGRRWGLVTMVGRQVDLIKTGRLGLGS